MATNLIQMTLAFSIVLGIALLYCNIVNVNLGEGMLLSSSTVVLALFCGSIAGSFSYGMYVLYGLAISGAAFFLLRVVKTGRNPFLVWNCPAVLMVFLIFIGLLFILYNDFIQHIDEFHEWAAAVNYMLKYNRMPTGYDFIGGGGQYSFGTSLFHLFFQKLTGYNEQNMYVSSGLLMWIGFLLPFSEEKLKDWKRIIIYVTILYISMFSLYTYGPKCLYVDLPTIAWSGGLTCWWIKRKRKRADCLILLSGLIMIHFFKASVGLLMDCYVVIFLLFNSLIIEKDYLNQPSCRKKLTLLTGGLCGLVCCGSAAVVYLISLLKPYETELTDEALHVQQWQIGGKALPQQISVLINDLEISAEKALTTLKELITALFGRPLSSRSNIPISFAAILVIVLTIIIITGELYQDTQRSFGYILFSIFVTISYTAVLYLSFVTMFAYNLSVTLRGVSRYFTICGMYLFMIALCNLLLNEKHIITNAWKYLSCIILILFTVELNASFIPNATALNKENVAGYKKITDTKSQIKKIKSIITDDDKVYFICQQSSDDLSGADLIINADLYYLEHQTSNYLSDPWKFTKDGSVIKLETKETPTIEDLPAILTQGGYTYLWIYKNNSYLKRMLPAVLDCKAVKEKSLYKIEYINGMAARLEYAASLK